MERIRPMFSIAFSIVRKSLIFSLIIRRWLATKRCGTAGPHVARNHPRRSAACWLAAVWLAGFVFSVQPAAAATRIKDICRVKGQEENTLHGLGLVVGLKGTGDGGRFLPTIRSLATAMKLMGNPIGKEGLKELKDAKNVALVTVTATVPAAGARQGDKIDCTVSSIGSAKSLAGGRLFITPLQGPQPNNPRIYAFAEGALSIEDPEVATTARIPGGCRLEEDFFNAFTKEDRFTLVVDQNHADFEIAQAIAEVINRPPLGSAGGDEPLARALNPVNIEVRIPSQYTADPVDFISQVLALEILLESDVRTDARVVINERTGSIVIDGQVEIGSALITHKNIAIGTGENAELGKFVPLHIGEQPPARLQSLVEALNAIKVPTDDIVDIIKTLDRSGKLHGKLILQ